MKRSDMKKRNSIRSLFFCLVSPVFLIVNDVFAFGGSDSGLVGDESYIVAFDSPNRLLSLKANRQPVYKLLNAVAKAASFDLELDYNFKKSPEMQRRINLNLNQVPLNRALDLLLGNSNRIATYQSLADKRLVLERVKVISAGHVAGTGANRMVLEKLAQQQELMSGSKTENPVKNPVKSSVIKTGTKMSSEKKIRDIKNLKQRLRLKSRDKLQRLRISEQKLLAHLSLAHLNKAPIATPGVSKHQDEQQRENELVKFDTYIEGGDKLISTSAAFSTDDRHNREFRKNQFFASQ